jgi:hypothetical protein
MRPTMIHYDNRICIKLSENLIFHNRSKNIEIRYYFIFDWVQRGVVQIEYIYIKENIADIITKSLPRVKHVHFRDKMGVVKNTLLGKRVCLVLVPWEVVLCRSTTLVNQVFKMVVVQIIDQQSKIVRLGLTNLTIDYALDA